MADAVLKGAKGGRGSGVGVLEKEEFGGKGVRKLHTVLLARWLL